MGWESNYQENLAFKSEPAAVPESGDPQLQQSGFKLQTSTTYDLLGGGSISSDMTHHHQSINKWDPVMTSLLKASNLTSSSSSSAVAAVNSSSQSLRIPDHTSNNPASILAASSAANKSNPNSLLTGPSSIGATATKVTKKRSRASRRPPTTILEADSANFRSMVQHLTGIPAPPPMSLLHHHHHHHHPARFDFLSSGLVRPQPTRPLTCTSFNPPAAYDIASSAGSLLQFGQPPPYTLRRLEELRSSVRAGTADGGGGSFMQDQHQGGARGSFNSALLPPSFRTNVVSGITTSHEQEQLRGGGGGGGGGGGNAIASGLSLPSLWDGEGLNARIKREVGVEDVSSGRPVASWSTSL